MKLQLYRSKSQLSLQSAALSLQVNCRCKCTIVALKVKLSLQSAVLLLQGASYHCKVQFCPSKIQVITAKRSFVAPKVELSLQSAVLSLQKSSCCCKVYVCSDEHTLAGENVQIKCCSCNSAIVGSTAIDTGQSTLMIHLYILGSVY